MSLNEEILNMAMSEEIGVMRSFYAFNSMDSDERVLKRFNFWWRRFFWDGSEAEEAACHHEIDCNNLAVWRRTGYTYLNKASRGIGKTVRTKYLFAFCICNDLDKSKDFIKVMCENPDGATRITTDIYNAFITVSNYYPHLLKKGSKKKKNKEDDFDVYDEDGKVLCKILADGIRGSKRGDVAEKKRPQLLWFDDFETRVTLRSAVITKSIMDTMDEAVGGVDDANFGLIYTCNYLDEKGIVHQLTQRGKTDDKCLESETPIATDIVWAGKPGKSKILDCKPTWSQRYTTQMIEEIRAKTDYFMGERLCDPTASEGILFDRDRINNMPKINPIKEINGLRMYREYKPDHAYGIGADVAGGVGLDSSAAETVDFSVYPAEHVASYESNTITPEPFGAELVSQGERWGNAILGIENNMYDSCISSVRNLKYTNIYKTQASEKNVKKGRESTYGYNTNRATKPRMLLDLQKAVEDGHLIIFDEAMKSELKAYTRDDLMNTDKDVRLVTKHWDKVMALAIAWQMKNFAKIKKKPNKRSVKSMISELDRENGW